MYTDKFGRPLALLEWAELNEDREYSIVGSNLIVATTMCPPSRLSTVWLGLNYNFWPGGPPLIFETMRFSQKEGTRTFEGQTYTYHPILEFPDPNDNTQRTEQVRWSTEEQARLGHARIVRLIQELEMQ